MAPVLDQVEDFGNASLKAIVGRLVKVLESKIEQKRIAVRRLHTTTTHQTKSIQTAFYALTFVPLDRQSEALVR